MQALSAVENCLSTPPLELFKKRFEEDYDLLDDSINGQLWAIHKSVRDLYNGTDAAIQVLPPIVMESLDSYPSPLPRVSDDPPSEIMELTDSPTPALHPPALHDAPTEDSNGTWIIQETESEAENVQSEIYLGPSTSSGIRRTTPAKRRL